MAWNEPGGGNKDPWSGKGGDQGPPELDEVVRKLQEKLGGLFGGGKTPRGGSGARTGGPGSVGLGLIGGLIFAIWLASGIYIVDPAERGVVLRFGAYQEVTQPGPHWHLPYPVEDVLKVNVDEITSFRHKAQMLTSDENIVDVEFTVQSKIQDAADFLFQDQDPRKTMKDATETAVRETIGKSKLDFILTEGRSAIQDSIKTGIQALLKEYRTGLEITSVNMQPAKPPEQVKSAFDDAIKAREDKERLENEAEAYANEVVPRARGAAARRIADANAYRDRVISEAEGETSRFVAVLREYEKAPEVTRQRLYLDAVETVLDNTGKVFLDTEGGNNLVYLPLDQLLQSGARAGRKTSDYAVPDIAPSPPATAPEREVNRGRRVR
jgi:membrane protease subunit HflK